MRRLHGADRRRAGVLLRARGRRPSPARASPRSKGCRRTARCIRCSRPSSTSRPASAAIASSGILISAAALLRRNPTPTRADIVAALDPHLCRCGMHNRVIRAVERAAATLRSVRMISNTLPQSLIDNPLLSQWIAFEDARPRPRRQRQGRDRPGHPDRAHPDRRRRARRRARAGTARVGPDRCQPGRGLHLGQLFDRGRRRLDPPGLRRGARAVPRSRWPRSSRCPVGELSVEDGQFLRAGKDDRPRLLVDRGRGRARAPRERHRADQAAVDLSHRRRATCRASTCRRRSRARRSSMTSRRRTSCMRACCGGRGAAPDSSRSTRTPCAAPPRRRSTSCARATSSPSRRRARSR